MAARKQAGAAGDEARVLVRMFRELTEAQFDFWIDSLNRAVVAMGGAAGEFSRDDRQKTVSYWSLLMVLLELYAAQHNPFALRKAEAGHTAGLITMRALADDFRGRYKEETVRRYISDLKRCGLIAHEGRGPEAKVKLAIPAIVALVDTINHWAAAFRDLDRRYGQLGTT
jgi:hypothetical protein